MRSCGTDGDASEESSTISIVQPTSGIEPAGPALDAAKEFLIPESVKRLALLLIRLL